jgi:hypothetical protein
LPAHGVKDHVGLEGLRKTEDALIPDVVEEGGCNVEPGGVLDVYKVVYIAELPPSISHRKIASANEWEEVKGNCELQG